MADGPDDLSCLKCLLQLGLHQAHPSDEEPTLAQPHWSAPEPPPLETGVRLKHYTIIEHLGSGGMGHVYIARDENLHRDVALKVLSSSIASDPRHLARFQREAQSLASLNHPNVVSVFSVESDGDHQFITMELVRGRTLDRLIAGKEIPLQSFLDVGCALAKAVAAAHGQGIIHRDLKPNNIMLTESDEVKVLDFGLAKSWGPRGRDLTTATDTSGGVLLGTVPYMSPEQIEGRELDARSDIFSLGIVYYEMLSGQHPFKSDTLAGTIWSILRDVPAPIRRVRLELPFQLEKIVGRCLKKDPADRYPAATALVEDLASLAEGIRHLDDAKATPKELIPRWLLWWALAAALALAVTLGIREQKKTVGEPEIVGGSGDLAQVSRMDSEPSETGEAPAPSEIPPTSESPPPDKPPIATHGTVANASAQRVAEPKDELGRLIVDDEMAATSEPQPERVSISESVGEATPQEIPSTFTVDAALYRNRGGAAERLFSGSTVAVGDELYFKVQGSRPLWVYVLNEDDRGEVYLLFPVAASDLSNPLGPGRNHRLPGGRGSRALNWKVSSGAHEERLLIIASPQRLDSIESLVASLPEAAEETSVYAEVPDDVRHQLRGIGGLVEVSETPGSSSGGSLFSHIEGLLDVPESTSGVWARRIDLRHLPADSQRP